MWDMDTSGTRGKLVGDAFVLSKSNAPEGPMAEDRTYPHHQRAPARSYNLRTMSLAYIESYVPSVPDNPKGVSRGNDQQILCKGK